MNTWRTTNTEALSSCFVYKSSGFVKFGEFLKSKEIVSSLERDFATSQSCTSSCTLSIWRRTLGPLPLTGTAVIFIFSIMMPLSYILPPSQVTSGYDTFRSGAELLLKIASLLRTYLPTPARPFLRACLVHRKSLQKGHRGHRESKRFHRPTPSKKNVPRGSWTSGSSCGMAWKFCRA